MAAEAFAENGIPQVGRPLQDLPAERNWSVPVGRRSGIHELYFDHPRIEGSLHSKRAEDC